MNVSEKLSAKKIASLTYGPSVSGKIEVAQVQGEQYVACAVKHGYDKWEGV